MPRQTVEEAAMQGWTHRLTLGFEDIADASTTQTHTIAIPAGSVVCNVGYYLETAFDGGATSGLTVTIGDGNDANGMLVATEIHLDATEVTYSANTGILLIGDENVGSARSIVYTADDTIDILFTATGANLSVMDAGKIHILADIKQLVPLEAGGA